MPEFAASAHVQVSTHQPEAYAGRFLAFGAVFGARRAGAAPLDVEQHQQVFAAGLPRVLAMTNRLVSWTDVAAGTARPEAEAYLEPIADQTLTLEAWLQMVGELRDGGLLGTIPLE